MIINFLPLSSIKNIKRVNFTSNPIASDSSGADTFERQTPNYSFSQQVSMIKEYDDKIADLTNRISKTLATRKAEERRIRQEYAVYEEQLALDKEKVRGTEEAEYVKFQYSNCLSEKYKKLVEACEPLREQEESYKTQREKLSKERELLISRLNPNVEFLTNNGMKWSQRKKILAQRPEIKIVCELPKMEDCAFKNLWTDNRYFVINKTNIGNIMDSSYELNKENYERLTKDGLLSFSEFAQTYGFDVKDLNRYISEGYLEFISLKNMITESDEPVHILDINNETNIKGLKRFNKICNLTQKSPYMDRDYLPAKYLANLGFGTEEELESQTKTKKLKGKIMPLRTPDGIKDELFIYCKNGAEGELKYLRNQNKDVMTIQEFASMLKLSETEIENAIIKGEVKVIPHYIYEDDKYNVLVNLKSTANSNFVDKKEFEQQLVQKKRNKNNSLRMRLAWLLSSETRRISDAIIARNEELVDIFDRRDKLNDYLERKAQGRLQDGEMEPRLTKEDKIKIRAFYKAVWDKAGTDEFKASAKRASIAVKEYREGGINAVQDEEIRHLLAQMTAEDSVN